MGVPDIVMCGVRRHLVACRALVATPAVGSLQITMCVCIYVYPYFVQSETFASHYMHPRLALLPGLLILVLSRSSRKFLTQFPDFQPLSDRTSL